ncbi:MAG: hypothetical protein WBC97_11395 [Gemmatimonadales bacterium]
MPPTPPRRHRSFVSPRVLRLAATALLGLAVMTCSDDHLNGPSGGTRGYFGFRPVTHLSAPPADFGIVIDSVHIRLTRPPSNAIVLDTTAFFPADSSDLKLALLVSLTEQTDTLDALIELKAGPNVVFRAHQSVVIVSGPPGSSPLPVVNLAFVGPGQGITHITVAPRDTAIALGDSARYSATADSAGIPIDSFYVGWKTTDTTLAKMNATGLLRAPNHRGTLKVIGTTPTGIADTTTVYFVPVATSLIKVSGDLQSDTAGRTTPVPIVVEAKAADALGVAGVAVHFSALSGGAVADSLVLTDSLGRAATPITLGTLAGPQKFLARVGALAPDTFTVTALAGAPSAIAIQAGNAQTDTTDLPLALPLSVKITDAFGNPATGAKVAWLRAAGGGAVATDTTASDSIGIASVGYTLGALARTDTISATLAGTSAKVTFTATAVAAVAANIVVANGGGQSDTVGKVLPQPLVVFVSDTRAHLVAGARVIWTAAHGGGSFAPDTTFTDSTGHTQTTYSLGTLAGTDSLVATLSCGGCAATFTVTALPGAPSALALQSGNAQADTINSALPLPLIVKAADGFGNPVVGATINWTRLAGGGTLSAPSSVSAAGGLAQVTYTLGASPRVDSIKATLGAGPASVTFTATTVPPAPAGIAIVSGSAQTDTVGDPLPLPLVVSVTGAGAKPVAGAKVAFSVKTGTGTFGGPAVDTATTDTLGHAQVPFTLGTGAGIDSVLAKTIVGGFTVTFAETAVAAAPTVIAIQSGNAQSDTAKGTLPLPLVVKVTDAHANPVAGAKIIWNVQNGSGTFAGLSVDTVVTAANGLASVSFTLGTTAGIDSLRATIQGTAAWVTFSATSTSGAASAISVVSGSAQSDTVAVALPAPLIVRVADGSNNAVTGVKVFWTRVFGTGAVSADSTVTDALGHAQVTFTLGTLVGTDSIKATLSSGDSVKFAATGTPGAPAAIAATGGNGQSGTTGTALPNPLTVKVTDAHTNAVPGVTVTWAVTGGGGTQSGITATTDATGTSTVAQWTLGGTAGTNTSTATLAGATGSPVTFTAVSLPLGTTKTWNGSAGTAWATALSWSPTGVPTSTDNVYIPSSVPAPSLTASASVGGLSVESGATLSLGTGDTLTTLGTVLVPAGASVTGAGAIASTGTSQQVSGTLANLAVTGSTVLAGPTAVTGAVTISGSGTLTVNGKSLGVGSGVTISGSGQLVMTNAADSVDVGGAYSTSGATSVGGLTAGVLIVRGNFAQIANSSNDFSASGTHITRFAGSTPQTITFANPATASSHFQSVEFANASGVTLASDIVATGTATVTAGTVSGTSRMATLAGLADATSNRWHVDTNTITGSGALTLPDSMSGVVALVGGGATLAKAFKVNGDLILTGSLAVSGHPLTVTGSLALAGSAHLQMTNATDSVDVGGPFAAAGASSTGDMTAGTLVLRGAFAQVANSSNDFAPSGTHRTIFAGTASQAVSFANPAAANSHFQSVTFANTAGIVLASNIVATGSVSVTAGQVTSTLHTATIAGTLTDAGFGWRADTTVFTGSPALPDSMVGSVHIQGNDTLAKAFKALGTLTVDQSGVLMVNGHPLTVVGAMTIANSGHFVMTNPADSVDVGGSYTAAGATGTGDLTAGKLVLRGAFTQVANSSNDFAASGAHQTIFAGSAAQSISFADPAAANSHFQDVTFDNAAGVTLATNAVVLGSSTLLAGNVTGVAKVMTVGADLVDASNSRWHVDTTVFTGSPTLPDSFSGSVHFQGTSTLSKALKVKGAVTVDGSGVLTVGGHPFTVTGNFATANSGRFVMTNATDSVDVGGSYTAGGATSTGDLTAGKLVLRGGFVQVANSSNDFAASGTHQTILAGSVAQSVSFADPAAVNSHFQILTVDNPAGVSFSTAAVSSGSVAVRRGAVTATGHGITIGSTLSDTSNVSWHPDTTIFAGAPASFPDSIQGVVRFQGPTGLVKALKIKGSVVVEGTGQLQPSGFPLTVTGGLSTIGSARFIMSYAADSVDVGGLFSAGSGTTSAGDLTQGVLVLRGGFAQSNSGASFAPSGSHRVHFGGATAQTIAFANPTTSTFNLVEFADAAGVTASTDLTANSTATVLSGTVTGTGHGATLAGTLQDASGSGWRMDTTTFTSAPGTLPDSIHGVVHFQAPVTMAKAFRSVGALYLDGANGVLTPNGFPLTVTGVLHVAGSGQLRMLAAADSVDVGGMTVATSATGVGLDTVGVLVLRGGFHQTGGTSTGFSPSGSHRTRLVTGSVDSVTFNNPGFIGGSHFNNVEITAGTAAIAMPSDVEAVGTLTKAPGASPTIFGNGHLLRVMGLDINGLVIDSMRLMKNGTAQVARFDSVTFQHEDTTFTQFFLAEGGSGVAQTFNGIVFTTAPGLSIGKYMTVADSVGNSQPVTINMNRSSPLYGGSFTSVIAGNDGAAVNWSHLAYAPAPTGGMTGLALPTFRVAIVGPLGDTLTDVSDSVTTVIGTNPVGGIISGATTVATVGGIATFSNVILTGVGNGYVLMSGANGFQPVFSPTINIDIQIPAGINAIWRGTVDSLWTKAANWQGGTVPDSTSNVYIPAAMLHEPYLATSGFAHINRLVIAPLATFKVDTFATVQVDSSLDNSANVTGGGTIELAGAGTVRGLFNNMTVAGNYAVVTGSSLQANGYLTISSTTGRLDLNGTNSATNGDLTVTNGGLLVMTHAADTLSVAGSASFNGGNELGFLTAGRILLQGNFAQYASSQLGATPTAFAATTGHVTELMRGSGIQTVHFANPDTLASHFGSLVLSGADSVVFDTLAIALGNLTISGTNTAVQSHDTLAVAGNVTSAAGSRLWLTGLAVAGTLNAAGAYHVGTTGFVGAGQSIPALAYDTIRVVGSAALGTNVSALRFYVGGAYPAAQFDLGGHTLSVNGDFTVDSAGVLVMTSANDTLGVSGNFSTAGRSTYATLTNGAIDLGGNFIQVDGASPASFAATGAHTVRFLGGQHTWGFATPDTGVAGSHFANLTVLSGGVARSTAGSATVVAGNLTLIGGTLVDSMTHLVGEGTVPDPVKVLGNVGADAASVLGLLELDVGGTITAPTAPAQYAVRITGFTGLGQTIPALPYQSVTVTGTASAASDLTLLNDLTIQNGTGPGTFDPAGHVVTVTGTLTTADQGALVMTHAADSVDVGSGGAFVGANFGGGSEAGRLTAGTLVIQGNFNETQRIGSSFSTSDSAFYATGTHRTVFTGAAGNNIQYATLATQFNKLDIIGAGGTELFRTTMVVADSLQIRQAGYLWDNGQERVVALGPVVADSQGYLSLDTLEVHSTLSVPLDTNFYVTTTRFAGTNQAIPSNLSYLNVDILGTVHPTAKFEAQDTLNVLAGSLDANGQTVIADSAFNTSGTGTLTMTNPADSVLVFGPATFDGGSTAGLLTAGVLQTPTFRQTASNSAASFAASGSHRLEIVQPQTCCGGEQIDFHTAGAGASQAQNLVISGNSTVDLANSLFVADTLFYEVGDGVVNGAAGATVTVGGPLMVDAFPNLNVDTLELRDPNPIQGSFAPGSWGPKVTRFAGVNQVVRDTNSYHTVVITGSAHINYFASADTVLVDGGTFKVGPGNFSVNGDFITKNGGKLTMVDPTANLFVSGNALFGGGSTSGLLTAGTITVSSGSFSQTNASGAADAFASSGTAVVFGGSDFQQNVSFADPGPSHFQDFKSTNGLGTVFHGLTQIFGNFADSGAVQGDSIVVKGSADVSAYSAGVYTVTLKDLEVAGGLTTNDTWLVDWTHFTGPSALPAITYNGNVVINAPVIDTALAPALGIHNLYVAGPGAPNYSGASASASLKLASGVLQTVDSAVNVQQGDLDPNGGRLLVYTDLGIGTGGTLTMTRASDSVQVQGDADFSGNSTSGRLTNGVLLLFGGLQQGGNAQAFAPNGAHTTAFSGISSSAGLNHNIAFTNPATSAFANLREDFPDTLTLQSAVNVSGRLSISHAVFEPGLLVRATAGQPLTFGGADVHAATFDQVPVIFAQNNDSIMAFDSVTFANFNPAGNITQFTVQASAPLAVTLTNTVFSLIGDGSGGGTGVGNYISATNGNSGAGTLVVTALLPNLGAAEFNAHTIADGFSQIIWSVP